MSDKITNSEIEHANLDISIVPGKSLHEEKTLTNKMKDISERQVAAQ